MGTLTVADVPACMKLCDLEATSRAASAEKDRPGFTVFLITTAVDGLGNEHVNAKIHPAIRVEGETATKLRPYYEYFGMTAGGRARLRVGPEAAATPPVNKWAGAFQ